MRATKTVVLTALISMFPVGCAKCRPDLVGAGVARLTVRNVGSIVEQLNADARCGFESPEVKTSFTTDGGSATWTVTDCELDFGKSGRVTDTDCNGNTTTISGKVLVSAKKTIAGTLTGNVDQPVVPLAPDAVRIELTRAELHNFLVVDASSDAKLTQQSGAISAVVAPKLGASASLGVCSIPTRNVAITDIRYDGAVVRLENESHDITAEVQSSDFWAINGRVGNEENAISGTLTIWNDTVEVPGDEDGLDPEYDREKFDAGYACTEDLSNPVSYECGDVAPRLAQGAARLTIQTLGAVADLTDEDTGCGFSSPAALAGVRLSGPAGSNGDATFRVESCTIDLPAETLVHADCNGTKTLAAGRYTVTATKKLTGRLSGDPREPVVPNSDTPAVVTIERATFENFRVESEGRGLTVFEGSLAGEIVPRVAMDTARGACAADTWMARFSNVSYGAGTKLRLSAEQGTFETSVDASNLTAVAGTMGSDTNTLDGTISIDGETYDLPTDPQDDGLDPEYEKAKFDSTWQCGTVDLQNPFECSIAQTLGRGAGQLSALTLGTVANLIEADAGCGFSSTSVLAGSSITGALGEPGGSATFTIRDPCRISFPAPTAVETDCSGKITFVEGTIAVRGTKTLSGYVSGDPLQPIVPTTRDPAVLALEITFTDFRVSSSADANALTVKTGQLAGTVRPRTAIDRLTGACSLPTPVASLEGLFWQNAALRVESEGKSFDVAVSASNLGAVNGSRDGVTNHLAGSITVDGEVVTLDTALDPSYTQAAFDASYACTPNLELARDDAACNLKRVLAEGTARLLVSGIGSLTGIVNDDNNCGFSANLTSPSSVVGDPGQMGSMEWEIQNCELSRSGRRATQAFETDCLQRASYWSGAATVSGMRHVDGMREEISLIIIRFQSIVPNSRESVLVTESMINFEEFKSYDLDPGETTPSRSITVHRGTANARVQPILGERADEVGTFDVPTKVARITNTSFTNAQVTIVNDGKTFNVPVDSAMLQAFNGSYANTGEKNLIAGTITVGGETFTLAPQALDPDFDQADFDARYACTDNLRSTVPAAP